MHLVIGGYSIIRILVLLLDNAVHQNCIWKTTLYQELIEYAGKADGRHGLLIVFIVINVG